MKEGHKNVIFPKYKYDDRLKIFREQEPVPNDVLYMALGYQDLSDGQEPSE